MERSGKRWTKKARWFFYPAIIGAIVFLVLTQPQDHRAPSQQDYNSSIELETRAFAAQIGDRIPLLLQIKNRGKMPWRSVGEYPCFLSYHLYLRDNYRTVRFDNRRFPLPHVVEPGETIDMEITLRAPVEANGYIIVFDMVREGQAWFHEYGSRRAVIRLDVTEREWPEDKTTFHSNRQEINQILKIIRLTLHQNEVSFAGKTGDISGFAPGVDYPQIWLRDANTILSGSRYFYGPEFLSSWLEEHLFFQKESGSLEDWIDSGGKSDKNTTETDQESSAVQAAFQLFNILGSRWLEKSIDGIRIIERLDRALEFVWNSRRNEESGLITGAHTADWGDVDMVDSDQQAIYVDERTHWTVDIYDQSMFHEACLNLAAMWDALDESERTDFWQNRAREIKKNTDKWLWQEDKGFYKVHEHLDDLKHEFDEEDMFAMGGNTMAILSGLADEEKSQRIILEALKRQEDHNLSTISGTLLPPYPKNVFKHPLLDDPFEYQNGAQWDWFGARLIYAMFQHGFSRTATEKCLEIIQKNLSNRGFFEWDNKEGVGLGSDMFAGTAGAMGKAVIEGYFGIKLYGERLSIEPKLGKDSAEIHIHQPANDIFVNYEYTFDETENTITLKYNSNLPGRGILRILLPWLKEKGQNEWHKENLEVQLDGQSTDFRLEIINNDCFVSINTDFLKRTARVFFSP